MSKLVLFGTGRGADVAYRVLTADTDHEICAFSLDAEYIDRKMFHGRPVVPWATVERQYPPETHRMLILAGYQKMNGFRESKYSEAKEKGYTLESYVCSDIFRAEEIQVGENCFILDNQSISLDVKIGNNVVLWSSNHIGDMTTIQDHAWISSHVTVAANVVIGQRSFIGIGATISNGVQIAPDSLIGGDVLVTEDTAPGGVYVAGERGRLPFDSKAFMRVMISRRKL